LCFLVWKIVTIVKMKDSQATIRDENAILSAFVISVTCCFVFSVRSVLTVVLIGNLLLSACAKDKMLDNKNISVSVLLIFSFCRLCGRLKLLPTLTHLCCGGI